MAIVDAVLREVQIKGGRTEVDLAALIFGRDKAYPQRVNAVCRQLIADKIIVRKGNGGAYDPFTYWLPQAPRLMRRV